MTAHWNTVSISTLETHSQLLSYMQEAAFTETAVRQKIDQTIIARI